MSSQRSNKFLSLMIVDKNIRVDTGTAFSVLTKPKYGRVWNTIWYYLACLAYAFFLNSPRWAYGIWKKLSFLQHSGIFWSVHTVRCGFSYFHLPGGPFWQTCFYYSARLLTIYLEWWLLTSITVPAFCEYIKISNFLPRKFTQNN